MIPFGPKLNTVFASRWKALTWAAVILLTAYCSVPSVEETEQADAEQHAQAEQATHRNPWALEKR
jgi:hypothetical protein